jgi:two-component system, NarL family, sensor histidine kinase DesK
MTEPAEQRASFEVPEHPGRRWGWMLSGIWIFYLASPFSDLLTDPHPLWLRIVGCTVTVAFAATYVLSLRLAFAAMSGCPKRWGWVIPIALLAVGLAMTPVVHENAATYIIFGVTLGLCLWPWRTGAVVAAAAVAWNGYGLPVLSGDDYSIELGIITLAVALLMLAIRRMQSQEWVIRRAHEDLAHMAVDAERARFSRDLHDIVGHSLTAIIVKAELAGRLAKRRPESVGPEVADIELLAREALEDVRRTVAGYREVTLSGELASARAVLDAAGVEAILPQAVDEVPGRLRELFGWVVREGVTNVVRHSRARHCWITVTPGSVEVLDDGRGPRGGAGNGLGGIRERARALGATVEFGAGPRSGFRLYVAAPEVSA